MEKTKQVKKEDLLDIVFVSIQAGKSIKQICSDLSISKQKIQYYLSKLKSERKIMKIGYGVWQTSTNKVANSIRGHGFMWHLKLPKQIKNWDLILSKKNIPFKTINKGNTHQIYFKENKIWISSKSIIIYDIKSYFGFNAIDSKRFAFDSIQKFLNDLQFKLGINILTDSINLKTSRQHYALVKNSLAIQCRKDGSKINVYNDKGLWFLIDNSYNLEEAETVHPKTALVDNLGVQKYFNEHKETKWEVTPKFVLESLGKMIQVQQMHSQNIVKHQKVLDEMLITLKKIQEKLDGNL
jgi:hypothetical protein